MNPVTYRRPSSIADAVAAAGSDGWRLLGGGTNLVDLMRKGVESPAGLLDVTGLLPDTVTPTADGGLVIGAAARNSAIAAHPLVRRDFPMLSRAILAGASAQIRNMATAGGNLMQRTRCAYFADAAGSRCNKREPGSGCDAIGGFNRYHSIFGASPECIASHPSDMAVALAALDARIFVTGANGDRTIPIREFYRLPGDRPDSETVLSPDEVIMSIALPPSPFAATSAYRKVRDRASYAFALVSVAAAVEIRDGTVHDVRIALGGVAPRPWRAHLAEDALRGARPTDEAIAAAIDAELAHATPLPGNAFKVELVRRTVSAVLAELRGEIA
ncbi:xanthine dehydrogenase YagS FAD-binding subunit [Catenuloplanes nepalensis]|uniref:Xanthine dehydrogenase YagS FAD-binding subunit n=1 Tax=Catenuloplanes nepalensis TaxID=587533 RepID=A0ABT9MT91_9ACTN|nr:xanthine dehydrogenase family protein subunit M [Catenuloplanes nepalensis]MDP9794660.1 xanthine dehydrogenase YagS FAD-binding subunit [Catenuloplanes nepalensis]